MSVKKNLVESRHRDAACDLIYRATQGEGFHCQECYEAFIAEVAVLLARGKVVMLRRDGNKMCVKLFSQ